MARNQVAADTPTTSKKRSMKTEGNIPKSKTNTSKNKKKTKNTIDANGNKKLQTPQPNEIKGEEDDNQEEGEAVSKKKDPSSKKEGEKHQQKNKKKKKVEKEEEEEDTKNESALYNFPMNRISRIIKGESDVRITQEAVFLINKASEKFLQLFTTEAFACSFLDKKNHISYQHLSSVVSKRRRFDFLSDFVPEKVKVEDALKETPSVET